MSHKHHIIPKHMGGSNDLSNLFECDVEWHAEYHKELWIKYRNWQDEIAYLFLSNQIDKEYAIKLAAYNANKGSKRSKETKDKMSIAKIGKKLSLEHKEKIGASSKGRIQSLESKEKIGNANRGRRYSDEIKAKMGATNKGKTWYVDKITNKRVWQ